MGPTWAAGGLLAARSIAGEGALRRGGVGRPEQSSDGTKLVGGLGLPVLRGVASGAAEVATE